jgi:hypothetical protein
VDLLTNVRSAPQPCHVNGISATGNPILATEIGDYHGFTDIYACTDAAANILSFSQTKLYCDNNYDKERDIFSSQPPYDKVYEFKGDDGLYVYKVPIQGKALVSTVSSNLQEYSVREQTDAKKAKDLSKVLGYPSPQSIIDMINNGAIINCPVTAKDVARANKIYGPDLASLRGKSRKQKTSSISTDYLPREVSSDLTLHVDMMFVNTNAYLISVSTPLGLTIVNELGHTKGSRSLKSVAPALMEQINTYASRQFKVKTINTDIEGAIMSMTSSLNEKGILVNPAGAGSHVPIIERKIQEVKQRARAIINSLPYRLAVTLLVYLTYFCVSRINLVPHKTGLTNISPTEAFKGRKIDFKRDLRVGFGEYAEVFDPYSDNTMRPRTQAGISLGPTGNLSGSVKFLSLATGRTITRDQFTILPIPDNVIQHMNNLASIAAEKYKANIQDPIHISMDPNQDFSANADEVDEPYQEYAPDPTISIQEEVHPQENTIELQDIVSDDPLALQVEDYHEDNTLLRGDQDPTPTIIEPIVTNPDVNTNTGRYNTRGSSRALRSYWDHKTHELINPSYSVLLCKANTNECLSKKSLSYYFHIFNISVKKALKSMPNEAIKSIYKEILQMVDKDVFIGMLPTFKHQQKVIKSFLFLKEKFKADGSFDKLKSRLVAGGHMQERDNILYEDINSPTASIPFTMMIATLAAKQKRHVKTIDVGGAYLNADISKQKILMELDPVVSSILIQIDPTYEKYLRANGTIVVMLRKALYGCIESAKLWYDLLSSNLISAGYTSNPLDKCIFNKMVNGKQCTIVVYVDDLFVTCTDQDMIQEVEDLLRAQFRDITIHDGLIHSYLGMTWDFSAPGEVKITMEGYISELLKECNIAGAVTTPATNNLFLTREAILLDAEAKSLFHTRVAKLLYLAKRVRPDILLAVSYLTTRVQAPDVDDLHKLTRVLKYINGTSNMGIILRAHGPIKVLAYIDAAYGVHEDGKSHSGLSICLGFGSVLSKSTKQQLVTKSSTEAELVAESDFASIAIFCKEFLIAQGEEVSEAVIYQDNMSTIAMLKNGGSKSDRTRHMNVRYFWTKERVDNGDISIMYIPTDEMIADILTKPLQGDKFVELRQILLNWYI